MHVFFSSRKYIVPFFLYIKSKYCVLGSTVRDEDCIFIRWGKDWIF